MTLAVLGPNRSARYQSPECHARLPRILEDLQDL
jgi:hypothetical protein